MNGAGTQEGHRGVWLGEEGEGHPRAEVFLGQSWIWLCLPVVCVALEGVWLTWGLQEEEASRSAVLAYSDLEWVGLLLFLLQLVVVLVLH